LDNAVKNLASSIESPNNYKGISAAPVKDRVNDMFWSSSLQNDQCRYGNWLLGSFSLTEM